MAWVVEQAQVERVLPDIKSLTAEELEGEFREWGEPGYRAAQVLEWIYGHHVTAWDAMTSLPKALRQRLVQRYAIRSLELIRIQGAPETTQKFLWRLEDHSLIESVLIPASPALYGEPSDRHTLCVSTQVGCAYGCKFCASGLEGWKRNLEVEEIVDQLLAVERNRKQRTAITGQASEGEIRRGEPQGSGGTAEAGKSHPNPRLVSNLVIMGMGEPLANYDHLLKALKIINAAWGGGIGARKITVSTSGLVPQIVRLADEPFQFRLAISLHGATDEVRQRIMPINRKYPLARLIEACEYYQRKKGRMITFEYILIAGVNDGLEQVKPLAALARKLHAKVNLIPYNTVHGLSWERPTQKQQEAFLATLERQKISATLRFEKGHDIEAACGQLRLKTEHDQAGADS
jgi:23S rRNA (adenine2503-C2)-methyltransferase